jgi:hypothetical protein
MTESEDQAAKLKEWQKLSEQAWSAAQRLMLRYDESVVERRETSNQRCEGGRRFGHLTVQCVMENIGKAQALEAIVGALDAIVDWPNAGYIAWQMRSFIRFAGTDCGIDTEFGRTKVDKVVELGNLIKRIAKEKPYGEKTVGVDILNRDWGWTRWDMPSDPDEAEFCRESILDSHLVALRNFADGKYATCLDRYPFAPDQI